MNILNEDWRDILGYEHIYQVSNFGNVRSLDRYVPCKNNSRSLKRGQFLSQKINRYGYPCVKLSGKLKPWDVTVHVLVAQAFIGDRPKDFDINHIDGNKANNHVSNLEYVTKSANNFHAFKNGLSLNGQKHPNSKLEDADIPLIRQSLFDGESQISIARKFNVSVRSIYAIAKGKTWHHIS